MAPTLRRAEIIRPDLVCGEISHAIFDFDGTLSWLRHGWPTTMLNSFLCHTSEKWQNDTNLHAELLADILSLNGKPSIYQLARCCERAKAAGIETAAAEIILAKYLLQMRSIVNERLALIRSGSQPASDFIVWNALRALEGLRSREVKLIILSGTAEEDVRLEAEILGLTSYFGDQIYGSPAQGTFSKKDIIEQIMGEEQIEGRHLLAFGDGPVEIGFTKAVGGLAIGVASDEELNGSHRIDLAKRKQLLAAGADVIIPDYAEVDALLAMVFST